MRTERLRFERRRVSVSGSPVSACGYFAVCLALALLLGRLDDTLESQLLPETVLESDSNVLRRLLSLLGLVCAASGSTPWPCIRIQRSTFFVRVIIITNHETDRRSAMGRCLWGLSTMRVVRIQKTLSL